MIMDYGLSEASQQPPLTLLGDHGRETNGYPGRVPSGRHQYMMPKWRTWEGLRTTGQPPLAKHKASQSRYHQMLAPQDAPLKEAPGLDLGAWETFHIIHDILCFESYNG